MYGVAQTRTRLLGRRTLNPLAAKQVLSECAIPTSRQNLVQIQYLYLKPDVPVAHAPHMHNFPPNLNNFVSNNYFEIRVADMEEEVYGVLGKPLCKVGRRYR